LRFHWRSLRKKMLHRFVVPFHILCGDWLPEHEASISRSSFQKAKGEYIESARY
jgi:hypothetical protein